jgi:lysophospholipase L1-like esterase
MKPLRAASLLILSLLLCIPATARHKSAAQQIWVGSWAASQQIPEPRNALPAEALQDATVRQIFHLSIGGSALRVRLSNVFGTEPLHFASVHIARAISSTSSAIVPGSDTPLAFNGAPDVTVPAGASYLSDPVDFPVAALSNLVVSYYLPTAPALETSHPGSRETTWYLHGNHVSDAEFQSPQTIEHWFEISGIDVIAPPHAAAIVALGDSITDGHATTTNGNNRWTDDLAERLQANPATSNISVLNEGIGGNHLLTDGLGPNALARFDRDVIAQDGVRWVIVLEGVNDLGRLSREGDESESDYQHLVDQITAAYAQMIRRAHTHRIMVIGATLTPFMGSAYYHPISLSERARRQINDWIRMNFDAVVDFNQAIRDPKLPFRILPAYDSGDHLHPSPAGYRAMANAIPLSIFIKTRPHK